MGDMNDLIQERGGYDPEGFFAVVMSIRTNLPGGPMAETRPFEVIVEAVIERVVCAECGSGETINHNGAMGTRAWCGHHPSAGIRVLRYVLESA